MANPISENIRTGTIGELLVQIRLLQYNVQAAPPLKDSGNDLIAAKGTYFKAIQVKTAKENKVFSKPDNDKIYHILAVVDLVGEDQNVYLDKSQIYLIPKEEVEYISTNISRLDCKYKIKKKLIESLFQ